MNTCVFQKEQTHLYVGHHCGQKKAGHVQGLMSVLQNKNKFSKKKDSIAINKQQSLTMSMLAWSNRW
jgi:hypothetical protein